MASIFKRKGRKSGKWLIAYTDENGARRVVTGAASKTVSEQIAAKLEAEAELRRRGIIDTRLDRYAEAEKKSLAVRNDDGKIIGGHLAEFHASIIGKGATAKHADLVRTRAGKVIELCKAERISDLIPSAVQAAIKSLRDDGTSLQTLTITTCGRSSSFAAGCGAMGGQGTMFWRTWADTTSPWTAATTAGR